MKRAKILITLLFILAVSASANAQNYNNPDNVMCPAVPQVNGPVSAALSKVTGMNAIISTTLESQVRKQLNKALNGDFKVEITPFGAKSMLEGKFKNIAFQSDSAYTEGIYLSNITAESMCGYNHFIYKNGQVYTNENFLLGFNANITSEDLQKSVTTPEYMKLVNSMNIKMGNLTLLKVFSPKAGIKNDRLFFSLMVSSPLTFNEPKSVSTEMGLDVEDGKFVFTDIKVTPSSSSFNINSVLPIINKLNPFVIHASVLNDPESIIKINDLKIENNKINIKGLVIVPKNYYNN